jgi:hypothetical protein
MVKERSRVGRKSEVRKLVLVYSNSNVGRTVLVRKPALSGVQNPQPVEKRITQRDPEDELPPAA